MATTVDLTDDPASRIFRVEIPTFETRTDESALRSKKYTAFVIHVYVNGDDSWTVYRRYREFAVLNKVWDDVFLHVLLRRDDVVQELMQRYASLKMIKFPPKKWFSSRSNTTVEQRRVNFEEYLNETVGSSMAAADAELRW